MLIPSFLATLAILTARADLVPPVFDGCSVPSDFCPTLHNDCLAAGVDPERCDLIDAVVCPGSACMAHDTIIAECDELGLDCAALEKHADAALAGCGCGAPTCVDTDQLSLPELFATCFTHPWSIGDDCGEPSSGQCMSILTLTDQYCDVSTCEYIECMEDMAAQSDCSLDPPPSCDKLVKCDIAENGGGPAGPKVPGPDDWTPAPPAASKCLRLAEVLVKPTGQVAHRQWVRIMNTCATAVSADGIVLKWTQPDDGWGGTKRLGMSLAGLGSISPGGCAVIGGPESVAANFNPDIDLPIALLPPPLPDAEREVAGVGLFMRFETVTPFDSVAYGAGGAGFLDHNGKPAKPVIASMDLGHSLVRKNNKWKENGAPSPNTCSGI